MFLFKNVFIKIFYSRSKYFITTLKSLIIVVLLVCTGMKGLGQVVGDFQPKNAIGNWSDFNAWNRYNGTAFVAATTGQTPLTTSDIFFITNKNITVDITNAVCNNIRLSTAGITETISFAAGSILSIFGNLLENNFNNIPFINFGIGSKIIFTGTANQTITNSGGNTNLYNVEINKTGGTFTLPGVNTKYDIFTLTAGSLVGANGATLIGLSTSSTITINGGNWTQIAGANKINGGSGGQDIALTINNGTMSLATTSGSSAGFNFSSVNVINNGILNLNSTGGGNLNITNTFFIDATSTVNSTYTTTASAITNNFLGTFNYNGIGNQNIINASYGNLNLLVSGIKTPAATLFVTGNLTISGNAILSLSNIVGVNIGGNWTNYGTTGLTESTSTVDFNGSAAQLINTIGGEDFFLMKKSGLGTLTLNSNVATGGGVGSGLNISSGVLDAGINTLSGTATTSLTMSGGILKLAKLLTTVPEFLGTYALTGGSVELNGAGNQFLKGGENYKNIIFSNSGTKSPSVAINPPTNTILGTITIANTAILDVSNKTFGGVGTNIIMTGTSRYMTAGTSTKPDASGIYLLDPATTIEFLNNAGSQQDIRLAPLYANIDISGSNVGLSGATSSLYMQTNTIFTVKNAGVFNVQSVNGFSGSINTSINSTNNPVISLINGSTVNYNGTSSQAITNILPYENLKFSGTAFLTAPTTNLTILGNLTRTGTHTFNAGLSRVVFAGAGTQTYSAAAGTSPLNFYNVSNLNTVNLILDSTIAVQNELYLSSAAKLVLNKGDINMRSTAANTAYITDLVTVGPSTNITYGTGRFIIERYLFPKKSWRLLATPVLSLTGLGETDPTSPSINNSWREGGTILSGLGTNITGPGNIGYPAGVDEYTQRGSMKSWDMTTNSFIEINSADLTANKTIANNEGYYVFIRGDRSITTTSGLLSATTLRMKGKIRTGNQTFNVNAGAFQSFGNPYTSAIDFRNVSKTNIVNSFIAWNPNSAGSYNVGAFETYTFNNGSGHYQKTPGNNVRDSIQSGEAVFVQTNVGTGIITVKENDKVAGSRLVSREGEQLLVDETTPTLAINLIANVNTTSFLADGAKINFDASYSNDIDNDDVRKIMNMSDNLFIVKNNNKFVVERHKTLQLNDTLFLGLTNTHIAQYRLVIDPSLLNNLPLSAFLKDNFLQLETALSLSATSNINFEITVDAASKAVDRFMIIFKPAVVSGPLAFSFTNIIAQKNTDKTNTIKWSCSNEINTANYSIERSSNAVFFINLGNVGVNMNNGGNTVYNFIDNKPLANTNYYRVKATTTSGEVQFSNTVKLTLVENEAGFTVNPNPIINKKLNLYFENIVGKVDVQLVNKEGAIVYCKQINLLSNDEMKTIELNSNVAIGNYEIVITDKAGNKLVKSVLIK